MQPMVAVVIIGGKQYKVTEGDTLVVDRLEGNVGDALTFDQVLFLRDDKKITVGRPTVKKASITAKILKQGKGEKIHVRRFKAKVRYRRAKGFRPSETTLKIISINRA